MKRIIIINNNDRAITYGIGTYTISLIECLKKTNFAFDIVYLNANEYELKIVEKLGYREFFVPAFSESTNKKLDKYCQMLPFLFKELFNEGDDLIFHFNYFITDTLIAQLKAAFVCKVLLTVHYTDWSLMLNGDIRRLKSLLDKEKNEQNEKTNSQNEKRLIDSIQSNKAVFRQADFILFVSHHTVMTYSALSIFQDTKYKIVHNGLKDSYKKLSKAQKSSIRKRYHIKDHETILFFVGRLDEIKGIYCLIEAFQKVLKVKQKLKNPMQFIIFLERGILKPNDTLFLIPTCRIYSVKPP